MATAASSLKTEQLTAEQVNARMAVVTDAVNVAYSGGQGLIKQEDEGLESLIVQQGAATLSRKRKQNAAEAASFRRQRVGASGRVSGSG